MKDLWKEGSLEGIGSLEGRNFGRKDLWKEGSLEGSLERRNFGRKDLLKEGSLERSIFGIKEVLKEIILE